MTSSSFAPSFSPPRRPVLRSIGAVAAGLVATFAITTAFDVLMHVTGVFPPPGAPPMSNALFLVALGYRLVFDVAGSYLTARLAPSRPVRHALSLGGLGVVLCLAGALAFRNQGPLWYPLALAASSLPCAWWGGRLAERRCP
jgi:hypothetical protein